MENIPKKLKVIKDHYNGFVECIKGDILTFSSCYKGVFPASGGQPLCVAVHYKTNKNETVSFTGIQSIKIHIDSGFYKEVKDEFGYREGLKHV